MVHYACRKCGATLFAADTITHCAGDGDASSAAPATAVSSVKTKWGRAANRVGTAACTSVFLADAPDWANGASGNNGPLKCPKCEVRVGNFSWSGATCSCGRWITPAFQFPLAKVDPKGAVNLADIARAPKQAQDVPIVSTVPAVSVVSATLPPSAGTGENEEGT